MNHRIQRLAPLARLFLALLALTPHAFSQSPAIQGSWEGALEVGGVKLRLVLRVTQSSDGGLSAKADSPDQGATDLPVDVVTFKDGALHFEMKQLAVVYDGTLNKESSEIKGDFKQGPASFPLTLKRVAAPSAVLKRPQEPKKPYPYDEEEVTYENQRDGIKLAGTLTRPRGQGPFPAVILITGSGAQDRNESLLGHKPFLVLADHLTRLGIAVLRVDDRGIGGSTGNIVTATSEDFATDVLAGVEFLKARKDINAKRIGLIGHSEGGIIAPMAAARSNDIAFIVLMAGTGLSGEEILYLQAALISKAEGADDDAVAQNRAVQEAMFKVLKEEKDNAAAEKRMMEDFTRRKEAAPNNKKKDFNEQAFRAQVKQVTSVWFRAFVAYDPRTALRKVKCPVLALNGEKDLQVPPDENLKEIEAALKAAGNRDVMIAKLPGLNHLFQTCKSGSPSEYVQIEETLAPVALKTISDWILKQTKP